VYSRGHGRKTHKNDAVWAGLAAFSSTGATAVTRDDPLVSLRRLCDRRDELTPRPGAGLSFGLIHPRSRQFTGVRGRLSGLVTDAGGRW
jgi:hypothetical protein